MNESDINQLQYSFKEKYPLVFKAICESSDKAIKNQSLKWTAAMWEQFNIMIKTMNL